MSNKEGTYSVYWPRGERTLDVQPVAPRLDSLSGKTVAFLWDYMFRGDEIFAILQTELLARFPGMRFIGPDEFGSTHGEDERKILAALPEKLKSLKVDAVISGMGC
ncbi:MAG: hypothetical protein NT123_12865 [Proteobacteria bacterium]|nr:hypothetical protein [Pseudomonadota bacterium]